jgi:hypothetical protein
MSYLRDAKIVKTIAESSNCNELSEDACRYILAQTELLLRRVIADSLKYTRKFNRSKIRSEDVDIALNDLNLAFLLFGLSKPAANYFVSSDRMTVELDKQEVDIKESMRSIVATKLLRKKKIEVNFDWMAIEGKLNPLFEASSTADSLNLRSADWAKNSEAQISAFETTPRADVTNYDYLTAKSNKNVFLVKELNPNVLTREASLFFDTFRKILEEYFQLVDQKFAEIDNKKFLYGRVISPLSHQDQLKDPDRCPAHRFLHIQIHRQLIRKSLC